MYSACLQLALVRQHISHGDDRVAVEKLAAVCAGTDRDVCLLLAARLHDLERDEAGVGVHEGSRVIRSRWRASILMLCEQIATANRCSGDGPPLGRRLEKIIGYNRIKPIAWLEQGLRAARAVGQLIVSDPGTGREASATAFLIEGSRIVTNWHVIENARQADNATLRMNYERKLSGELDEAIDYRLDGNSYHASERHDCAVVGVKTGQVPLDHWGTLVFEQRSPSVGEFVTIVQHPRGGPKSIALSENVVVGVSSSGLQYTTDTEPGSSGSPVLSDDWRVLGLHRGSTSEANEATSIAVVVRELELW